MTRKKILFITSWYPNSEDPTLGIFVRRHAEASSLFNDVFVLYVRSIEGFKEATYTFNKFNDVNELIIEYPKTSNKIPGLKSLIKLNKYKHFFNEGLSALKQKGFKPDLIHCNIMNPSGMLAHAWKKKHNLPYVITEHWTGYLESDNRYSKDIKAKAILPKIAKAADWVLPVSNDLLIALKKHELGLKYKVVRNVVDTEEFVLNRTTTNQFLVIADLDNQQKNIRGILNAFSKFHKENSHVQLTIAGGGDDEASIKEQINSLQLQNVVNLIGRVEAKTLSTQLNQSYALVLFSNYENLPCVIVESFACGTPVISTNVGGIREILNTERGILIQPKNEKELLQAFSQAMNTDWDNKKLQKYAEDNFSLKRIGQEFNAIYKEVLKVD